MDIRKFDVNLFNRMLARKRVTSGVRVAQAADRQRGDGLFRVHGHFRLLTVDTDGVETVRVDDPNLIVESAFSIMAYAWGAVGSQAGDPTYENIRPWFVAFGDDNTAAAASQTNLVGTFQYGRAFDSRTLSSTLPSLAVNKVMLEFRVPTGDAVGSVFREAGLFSYNHNGSGTLPEAAPTGGMLARKTFAEITKQGTFEVVVQWGFEFSAV